MYTSKEDAEDAGYMHQMEKRFFLSMFMYHVSTHLMITNLPICVSKHDIINLFGTDVVSVEIKETNREW